MLPPMTNRPTEHEVLAAVFQIRDGRTPGAAWQRARAPRRRSGGRCPVAGCGDDEDVETSVAAPAGREGRRARRRPTSSSSRCSPRRDRVPGERVIATAFLGLVPLRRRPGGARRHRLAPGRRAAADRVRPRGDRRAAHERLRAKLSYTNIGFALAPPEFTISALRELYSAALGHPVSATNLQRVLTRRAMLEPTGEIAPPGPAGGRPAALFRFTQRSLRVTDPFAVLRPTRRGRAAGAVPWTPWPRPCRCSRWGRC